MYRILPCVLDRVRCMVRVALKTENSEAYMEQDKRTVRTEVGTPHHWSTHHAHRALSDIREVPRYVWCVGCGGGACASSPPSAAPSSDPPW